jgi:8-oxo-dGTP diphosphatase
VADVGSAGVLLVVAAALIDADGRVLMQRRPAGKAHAGLWEFPGGKVEPGESAELALARELEEELGIIVAAADLAPLAFASVPAGARSLLLLLYVCDRWHSEPQALEADALTWRHPADLRDLPMPPADVPLVAALQARESRKTSR